MDSMALLLLRWRHLVQIWVHGQLMMEALGGSSHGVWVSGAWEVRPGNEASMAGMGGCLNDVARNSREGKDQPGREDRCGPPEDFSEKGLLSWTSWEKKEWQRYPQ